MLLASHKLPLKCKFVTREDFDKVPANAETGGEAQ
jgi:ribosomal protein L16/L10AE